jgi:hypothetical protein
MFQRGNKKIEKKIIIQCGSVKREIYIETAKCDKDIVDAVDAIDVFKIARPRNGGD